MDPIYLAIFVLGGFICAANFYLSLLRYTLIRIVGSRTEYRHISGFPIVGSPLIVISLLVFRIPHWALVVGLMLAALDTGGVHWLIGVMAWHRLRSADASPRER